MPQSSPGTLRTPRSRALEIGTNPKGFEGGIDYDPQAGVPSGTQADHYQDQKPAVSGGKPSEGIKPFTLK